MTLTEEEREAIRQRLIANVAEIRRKMDGVTEEEILEALRDDDEPPKNGRGAKRRASASTRTPSPRA